MISTFDVLVRGDVFLKFPCYFVAPSWSEDGLLYPRFEFVEFVVGSLVELIAERGEIGLNFVGVGEGTIDIIAADVVDLSA